MSPYKATRGVLATGLVILSQGQVTTPEQTPLSELPHQANEMTLSNNRFSVPVHGIRAQTHNKSAQRFWPLPLEKIELREDLKSRRGLAVSLEIICHNCEESTSTMSSKISNKCYDVNLRLTYGMRAIGKGGAAARIFCGAHEFASTTCKSLNAIILCF
ncbi:hypothetical protein TNCV_1523221 [Trichonephila clavipes]|nr:hypothetical protein TNCV_1523221 [Trichonephila clavipes]